MKTLIAALLMAVDLISGGLIYPATMEVVDVQAERVTFETATGHQYVIYDGDDWDVGDLASMIMFSNGTPNDVTDDLFLAGRYSGFSR